MMDMQNRSEGKASVFRSDGALTLADVAARADAELEGTPRRDTASAFRTLVQKRGIDLATIPATAPAVRELIGGLTPGDLGVSKKRLANLRSLIVRAVERFGMRRRVVGRAERLSPAWRELLGRAEPKHYRYGLNRLGVYCSGQGIAPGRCRRRSCRAFTTHSSPRASSRTRGGS